MSQENISLKQTSQVRPPSCDHVTNIKTLSCIPRATLAARSSPISLASLESGSRVHEEYQALMDTNNVQTPQQLANNALTFSSFFTLTGFSRLLRHPRFLKGLRIFSGTLFLLVVIFICLAETIYLRPLNANRTLLAASSLDTYGLTLVENVIPRRSERILRPG